MKTKCIKKIIKLRKKSQRTNSKNEAVAPPYLAKRKREIVVLRARTNMSPVDYLFTYKQTVGDMVKLGCMFFYQGSSQTLIQYSRNCCSWKKSL